MKDRMGDIPSWAVESLDDDDDDDDEGPFSDIEMGQVKEEQPSHMTRFFGEVETIKSFIQVIRDASANISKLGLEAIRATTTEKEQAVSKKLKPIVDKTNKQAKQVKDLLGFLKEETSKLKEDGTLNSSDERVRDNLYNTLTREFIDVVKNYQNAQQQYKTDIQKKIKRQVLIVKPDATDEEVDTIMKSEGGRDSLYQEQILAGAVSDQIKTTHAKLAGKYQDVLMLEQSVAELHQMFLDFALLTERQGEILDQIEFHVTNAADHVEDGNVHISAAIAYQKLIRKKQCWIILIVVVVLIAVLFKTGIL